jgi:hypothetical protein
MGGTVSLLGREDRDFLRAAKHGDAETALKLLRLHNKLLRATSWRSGHTAWHYLMLRNDSELFLSFLQTVEQHKADALDAKPATPVDVQKTLNKRNAKGQNTLMLACQTGHLPTISKLLDLGANMQARDRLGKRLCLHYAAQHGHPATIQTILAAAGEVITIQAVTDRCCHTPDLPILHVQITPNARSSLLCDSHTHCMCHGPPHACFLFAVASICRPACWYVALCALKAAS